MHPSNGVPRKGVWTRLRTPLIPAPLLPVILMAFWTVKTSLGHKANQISICGANWCKNSWTHHRLIDGLHYSWLVLGKTLTTYPWHIIHICLIFQWPNKKNRPKRRQENAKKCDKNFLISARKKPSRPQNQKFCILKNITRQEIEFGVEWCF